MTKMKGSPRGGPFAGYYPEDVLRPQTRRL